MFRTAETAVADALASVRSAVAALGPTDGLSIRDGLARVQMLEALRIAEGNLQAASRCRRLALADAEVRARG